MFVINHENINNKLDGRSSKLRPLASFFRLRGNDKLYTHLRARQNGVVLVIALIVLVAMTLAGIALMRSVDTTNVIAGNLAFQQVAKHAGDKGIEAAIDCLTVANTGATLQGNYPTCGYLAAQADPPGSWDAFWTATLAGQAVSLPVDAGGNTVSYVVHRLCKNTGPITDTATGCSFAPSGCDPSSSHGGGNPFCGKSTPQVYYRITSRIAGPRNTVSYVQAIIAM